MNGIKRFLDQRGKRFWWTVRFVFVGLIALAVFVLGWIGGSDYVTNIYTELIGVIISIGVTVVIVDQFYERRDREREKEQAQREEERRTEELKRRLVRDAGSRSNDVAIAAIDELREREWLEGDKGLLKGADLWKTNLKGAFLYGSNLQGAYLLNADLQKASLRKANLRGADLSYAKMQKADLLRTNLQETILTKANLQEAVLFGANLQEAVLIQGNLQEAILEEVNLNNAILPDGTKYTSDTDLERFTSPEHPEFAETLKKINDIRRGLGYDDLPGPEATTS